MGERAWGRVGVGVGTGKQAGEMVGELATPVRGGRSRLGQDLEGLLRGVAQSFEIRILRGLGIKG